jgi:carbon starvation protein
MQQGSANRWVQRFGWTALSIVGAFSLGTVALSCGETVNALWIVIAALCVYLIAYRYYSRYIAKTVLKLDPTRMTPAYKHNDGLDYVPTNKHVLFGHHFAAIAGAGPLVGPVLAAQMGYLPGMLWILAGVVFAGAVQDFIILFVSIRRDGRSLGALIKAELGVIPGVIALFGAFMIMVIILAVLALIVVKALTNSPWGTFTVAATIPIAVFMSVYLRYMRPGKIGEISAIGFILLMAAIAFGQNVAAHSTLALLFDFDGKGLTWILIIYGFIAAVLPVWLLLAPRDYLSTFLKIGTIIGHHYRFGLGYFDFCTRAKDAGYNPLYRWQRSGMVRQFIPVPVHHYRLRRGVGFSCPNRIRHDPQADRKRKPGPLHWLWWDADGIVGRYYGIGRGMRH